MTKFFFDTNIFANWLIADNTGHDESSLLIRSCLMGAARERVDFIVTENTKDFKFSRIKALSARDALSMVS